MSLKVVIIGGVALGPKAACRIKRVNPDAEVTLVDASKLISYGGCGIPYYVSGDVSEHTQLQETSFHMVRDEEFFRVCKHFTVITETRALSIDRKAKTVLVRAKDGTESTLPYDKLVLGTGSRPRVLPIPGTNLANVFTVTTLEEAIRVKEQVSGGGVASAVIVGAGFIGLEMAEALSDMWDIRTTVVEVADQVMPGFISPTMAQIVEKHLDDNAVTVRTSEMVQAIEGENGKVTRVVTNKGTIDADLVILSVGVIPNDELARAAGLTCAERGGVVVSKTMQTSDPDIYAGGDCVVVENLITGKHGYYPLGSLANRQGRVIGTNVAGGRETFDGVVGTFILKVFEYGFGGVGLSLPVALREGYDAFSTQVLQFDHSHFYPKKDMISLEIVVDRPTGRVLGVQGSGTNGDSLKDRIDAVAAVIKFRPTLRDIANMELAYAPPFGSAMDVLNAAANAAENILSGRCTPVQPDEFAELWKNRVQENLLCVDVREWGNAEPYVGKHPEFWRNIPQGQVRARLAEVPRDKKIVLLCNTGGRSYEAQVSLRHAGFTNVLNLQGGMGFIKQTGFDPSQDD
ncbi:MAG: pyridine nucleotide-disulfide oxidoreductase [Deltaproteobacteria bacterium]|nr:pyridine nucleotide-disulfide oxidoreductase [Deltaproteobacteria bacterium]